MKNTSLFLLCFLLSAINIKAQNEWPSADSQWYFGHDCFTFSDLTRVHVSGTEEILGIECTVMHFQLYYFDFQAELEWDQFVYYNGDTLFWLFEGEFYPLLCFNLEIGDTWHPLPIDHPNINSGCAFSPMQVKEKSFVEYNGIEYRQLVIAPELDYPEDWSDPWPHIYWQGVFDERTFGRSNFFPTFNICGGVVEWDCPEVRCYGDSELSLNFVNGAACNPTGVFIEESVLIDQSLFFPNPVRKGEFVQAINNESIRSVSVFTLSGQRVGNGIEINHTSLQINLTSGYYIVESELTNGQKIRSKLMVLP
jgi:hypothetical protein